MTECRIIIIIALVTAAVTEYLYMAEEKTSIFGSHGPKYLTYIAFLHCFFFFLNFIIEINIIL